MPPIRDHTIIYTFLGDEDDELEREHDRDGDGDDPDMPPLVDAPASFPSLDPQTPPPPRQTQESMMSSFDFSGVAFNTPFAPTLVYSSSSSQQQQLDADAGDATPYGDAISSNANGGRTRAKGKRAPSYIPRPPNAFILFRSSFIRSQNVPGRVEGNHSTLSKIIGKYWHALPATERARWEDKARAAQAEHRRRYPDWRFRPGNGKNAFASGSGSAKPKGRRKGRIKDGGGADDGDPPPNPHTPPSLGLDPDAFSPGGGAFDENEGIGVGGSGASPNASKNAKDKKGKGRADGKGRGGVDLTLTPMRGRSAVKGKGKGKAKADDGSDAEAEIKPDSGAEDDADGDEQGGGRKGKGKARPRPRSLSTSRQRDAENQKRELERLEQERLKLEKEREREEADARCEKISDLLVEGKTGRALEAAVEEWEWEGRGRGRGRISGTGTTRGRGRERASTVPHARVRAGGSGMGTGRRGRERRGTSSDVEISIEVERQEVAPQEVFVQQQQQQQQPQQAPFAQQASPARSPYTPPLPSSPFAQHPPPPSPFESPTRSPFAPPANSESPYMQSESPYMTPASPYMQHASPSSPYMQHTQATSTSASSTLDPGTETGWGRRRGESISERVGPNSELESWANPFVESCDPTGLQQQQQQQQQQGSPSFAFAPAEPPPPSPFASESPTHSPFAASLSASPVPSPATASGSRRSNTNPAASLMLPPLTHMYKRSLSAPCGASRVALPPELSMTVSPPMGMAMTRVQEGVGVVHYPPSAPYFEPPPYSAPPPLQQQQGHQEQPQQHQPQHSQTNTHVRRDTISFPVFPATGTGLSAGTLNAGGLSAGLNVGGYQHPIASQRRERGAYTYPPPYAHASLPEPGMVPNYGAPGRARHWWDRARGVDAYADTTDEGGDGAPPDMADDGWADGGTSFSDLNPVPPSPSPPASLASPYAAHAKAAPIPSDGTAVDPYVQPLPLSPVSDDAGSDPQRQFRFPPAPPAISSFSTLSGWAGDFNPSPPASMGAFSQGASFSQASGSNSGMAVNASAGSSGGRGSDSPPRTSGWYQAPGWENSIQGAAASDPLGWSTSGEGSGYVAPSKAPWAGHTEWPGRGDVEMEIYDTDSSGWGPHR